MFLPVKNLTAHRISLDLLQHGKDGIPLMASRHGLLWEMGLSPGENVLSKKSFHKIEHKVAEVALSWLNLGDFIFYFLFSLQEIPSDQTGWFSRTFVSGLLNPIPLKYFQCLQINGAFSPKSSQRLIGICYFVVTFFRMIWNCSFKVWILKRNHKCNLKNGVSTVNCAQAT